MTRMQRFTFTLGALLLLAAGQPVRAQTDLKIGFVNVQRLIENAPQTMEVNQRLRDEFAPKEAELITLQEDLQKRADNFQRDQAVMGEAERNDRVRELQNGERDLQRRVEQLQEDISIRQNELINELQTRIMEQVQAWARTEGYDLIVTSAVFASPAANLTDKVLAAIGGSAAAPGE